MNVNEKLEIQDSEIIRSPKSETRRDALQATMRSGFSNLNLKWLFGLPFCCLAFTAQATVLLWTNTAGGNWSVAANWEPNQVPGIGDTAFITNSGTYTVALDTGPTLVALFLGGTSGTQTLAIAGQTLNLGGASTVAANGVLLLDGGALSGTGTLTVSNVMNWTAGGMQGGGRTVIAPGAVLDLANASDVTLYPRTLENGGTVQCTGPGHCAGRQCGDHQPAGGGVGTAQRSGFRQHRRRQHASV